MLKQTRLALYFLLMVFLVPGPATAQPSAASDPAALLARTRQVMGFDRVDGKVLHYHAGAAASQNYQSDRTYPPFFDAMQQEEVWFDPASRVLRVETHTIFPGAPPFPAAVTLDDGNNAATTRGTQSVPISRQQATARYLSPWAVIADWSAANDVRVAGTETYRDYPRIVLTRHTPEGEQKLYLDGKSGFPVKLDMIAPHYLWGQRHMEYVWSTWVMSDGISIPGAAFELADGATETSQTVGAADLLAHDAAPAMPAPAAPAQAPAELPTFLQAIAPKTIQVSDHTWLLSNPGYTETVTLAGNDIYIFDATQSEERAKQDQEIVAKLFPGEHKINVVVTDQAWPHVAGLRYWVSQRANIIGHRAAEPFLREVIGRRWTLHPDSLESARLAAEAGSKATGKAKAQAAVAMHFLPIDQPQDVAGGAIRIAPIDGIGSEVALMAFVKADKFLWASDYIQDLSEPTQYAGEVIRAAERADIHPERAAAEHLRLSEWKTIVAAQAPKSAGASGGQ